MMWNTHVVAGMTAGIIATNMIEASDFKVIFSSVVLAGISSLIPDIDTPQSKYGRKLPVVSSILRIIFGHRKGFFHSLLGAAVVSWLISHLAQSLIGINVILPVFAGYLSHLLLDSLTPGGCYWLWPIRKKVGVSLVKTGGAAELFVVFPLFIFSFLGFSWLTLQGLYCF